MMISDITSFWKYCKRGHISSARCKSRCSPHDKMESATESGHLATGSVSGPSEAHAERRPGGARFQKLQEKSIPASYKACGASEASPHCIADRLKRLLLPPSLFRRKP